MSIQPIQTADLLPGQWVEFSSPSIDIGDEQQRPYKVIFKKINPCEPDVGMCYLLSISTNLLEYRRHTLTLGPYKVPKDAMVRTFDASDSLFFDLKPRIQECATKYLKSLVTLRVFGIGIDPESNAMASAEKLRRMFFPSQSL